MRLVGPSGNESLSAIGLYLAVKLFYILPLLPTLVECWLAQVDSNHRPRAYQARALTTWAMSQFLKCKMQNYSILFGPFWLRTLVRWWRWWDSNPWPPACRAGALPAELHPHIVAFGSDIASQWYYFVVILLRSVMPLAWVFAFSPKDPSKLNNESKLYSLRNRHLMSHTFL